MVGASRCWKLAWFAFFAPWLACSQGGESTSSSTGNAAQSSATSAGATAESAAGNTTGSSTADTTTASAASTSAGGSAASDTGSETATSSGDGGATNGDSSSQTTGADGGAGTDDGDTTASGTSSGSPDPAKLTLYYLDVTEDQVMALDASGDEPELVVEGTGQGPDGIAVDARAGHLYWTNMGVPADDDGFILRSDLDGANVTTIIEPGETYTPKQIKLEPEGGKLYWSDREGMAVMRSNLDGSEIETLVTIAEGADARADLSNHAVGIAVDSRGGYVYWIQKGPPNGGEGSIRRAGLEIPSGEDSSDRTDIEILYAGLPEPIDLDVDVEAAMMYWTDRGDATINRAPVEIPENASATTRDDREILVNNVDVAIGIWLDLEAGHVYYTGTDVVGRVDLDGANNTVLVQNAGVLTGITGLRAPSP